MAGAGKDNIYAIKQEVPKFIREFKERTNQPPPPDINSKRFSEKDGDEDDNEKPDEAPVICVGKGVTDEEAYAFTKDMYGEEAVDKSDLSSKRNHDKDDDAAESGKVVFKKPTKAKMEKKETNKARSKMPKVKNKTLLSFGDDDEEEEDT